MCTACWQEQDFHETWALHWFPAYQQVCLRIMRKRCLLKNWWWLKGICNKSWWNPFEPAPAPARPWSAKPSLGLINAGFRVSLLWFWSNPADEGQQDPREGPEKVHGCLPLVTMVDTWCLGWTARKGIKFLTVLLSDSCSWFITLIWYLFQEMCSLHLTYISVL